MPTKEELQALLTEAEKKLKEFEEFVEKVTAPPMVYCSIARVNTEPKTCLVLAQGTYLEVPYPRDFVGEPKPGQILKMAMESKVPVDIIDDTLPGQIMLVKARISEELIELDQGGAISQGMQPATVAFCNYPVEPGDRVVMDQSRQVVMANLGPDPSIKKQNVVEEFEPVYWDDIGGLQDVKDFFYNIFERPHLAPEVYRQYKVSPPKGALLSGPPGCGKTLIAKAVMTDLAARHGGSASGGFLSIKGPELLSMWVGATEERIRDLFKRARAFFDERGFPAVIFIDEAEAIMNKRGSGRSSDVDRTIVPAFLAEMDGVEKSGAIVILATNRPEMLDPAIVREGRIDRKVRVPRPNLGAAGRILEINLQRYPLSPELGLREYTEETVRFLFSDAHRLYNIHMADKTQKIFKFSDVLSGAICAAVVKEAASTALSRDIERNAVSGITLPDLKDAVKDLVQQHRYQDYSNEVEEFTTPFKDDVTYMERVTA